MVMVKIIPKTDYLMIMLTLENSTASKVSVFGVILVRIFPHSHRKQSDTPYLSVFSRNAGKYGPE